jgi:DNA-binding response OmpR family regulator
MFNKAVMVVDNDADALENLATMLKRQGLVVLKVHDAASALHLVRSLTPDLFLLNMWTPGLDGSDLCRRLRANRHTAKTPVIIFSASNTPHARHDALASGADLFFPKEDEPAELLRAVQALLERNGQPQAF